MRVVRHATPESFQQHAFPFLVQREATHNLILGLASRYAAGFADDMVFAHVEDDAGVVVAAAMRTPPHGAVLSAVDDKAAIPVLVDAFAAWYNCLPTVLGDPEDAQSFAELWQAKCVQSYNVKLEQGIYQLERVIPVQNVSGEYRPAARADFDLFVRWMQAFSKEALNENVSLEHAEKYIDAKIDADLTNALRVWWDDGQPVSLVTATRPTPNGICVTLVYTPPEFRGHGYASAVTAALSQELLDSGRKFCFLFTDMSNPTSNKIYQNIGYELVCHQRLYQFNVPA